MLTIRQRLRRARVLLGSGALREPVFFSLVGALGFLIDAGLLMLLFHAFEFSHYGARTVSFLVAVAVTWHLNRNHTFVRHKSASGRREFSIYVVAQLLGVGINIGVYTLCISLNETMRVYPERALAAGSLTAMTFNFFAARYVVFRRPAASAPS